MRSKEFSTLQSSGTFVGLWPSGPVASPQLVKTAVVEHTLALARLFLHLPAVWLYQQP